jgi:uncharacterized protein YbjT (DUF2867 family)
MEREGEEKKPVIVVAGANGQLGQRMIGVLLSLGVQPRALVRSGSQLPASINGATIIQTDYHNGQALIEACHGADCVVSALSGLQDVIIHPQAALLRAAVKAGVRRFIPSDFCIDYTQLPEGSNRNLDLRRAFRQQLDSAPVAATSIFNGMFTDLLLHEAPLIQAGMKRVLYWGKADQLLDFTTIDDTAAFTARAALESHTPRFLRIAGDTISSKGLQQAASKATGQHYKLTRIGGLGFFKLMIRITKTLVPQPKEVFPPWQGMQYMHNMYTGLPKLEPLDNDRYPDMHWTTVEEVLRKLRH